MASAESPKELGGPPRQIFVKHYGVACITLDDSPTWSGSEPDSIGMAILDHEDCPLSFSLARRERHIERLQSDDDEDAFT